MLTIVLLSWSKVITMGHTLRPGRACHSNICTQRKQTELGNPDSAMLSTSLSGSLHARARTFLHPREAIRAVVRHPRMSSLQIHGDIRTSWGTSDPVWCSYCSSGVVRLLVRKWRQWLVGSCARKLQSLILRSSHGDGNGLGDETKCTVVLQGPSSVGGLKQLSFTCAANAVVVLCS